MFAGDRTTGVLTQLPGEEGCIGLYGNDGLCTEGRALRHALRVDVSPDGRHVYAGSSYDATVAVLERARR